VYYIRKIANWTLDISLIIFFIDWGVIGIKLLDNDYHFTVEAYIGLICYIIIFVSISIRCFTDRSSNCKKILLAKGKYCSYCGKEIKNNFSCEEEMI